MKSFNTRLALKMTRFFGSMACFYVFVLWALLPVIPFFSKYQVTILYVSAGFIQLVALPLLAVGQQVQSEKSEKRMEKMMLHISKTEDTIKKEMEKYLIYKHPKK